MSRVCDPLPSSFSLLFLFPPSPPRLDHLPLPTDLCRAFLRVVVKTSKSGRLPSDL